MEQFQTVFVTGGAGYIGSHTIIELLNANYEVIVIDNFVNSVDEPNGESSALKRVETITGKKVTFYKCDLLDRTTLFQIFEKHDIDCVIHFAAIKAVGESMEYPLLYYKNNLVGMLNLLEVMEKHKCFQLVFSSSCTIYGEPKYLPITEDHTIGGNITNVYGKTKYFIEEMLADISHSNKDWNIICLRYFNPVGAHPSGLIGEDPTKAFTNIMPYIAQVAIGHVPLLTIFGDYETADKTGVRDYIHVMDLATGHVAALRKLYKEHQHLKAYNLGTGKGVSVLQLVKTFEKVTGSAVPYRFAGKREGDITAMYADADLAEQELGWKAKHTLDEMCIDFWRWKTMNPCGYRPNKTKLTNGH